MLKRILTRLLIVFGGCAVLAVIVAYQWSLTSPPANVPVSIFKYLPFQLLQFFGWGFLILWLPMICSRLSRLFSRWIWIIAAHLVVGMAMVAIQKTFVFFFWSLCRTNLCGPGPTYLHWWPNLVWWLDYDLMIYALAVGIIYGSQYYRKTREKEMKALQLQNQLSQARLQLLRMQLHPHFLYNALNTISAFTEKNPRTARWIISRLGDLLRAGLETHDDMEIPLGRELGMIKAYLDIETLRFQDRLTVNWDIDPELESVSVPAMILQPLVENAIRHGISRSTKPGEITLRARRIDSGLRVEVIDTGPGIQTETSPGTGIGIDNVKKRLAVCYPGTHRFAISPQVGGGTGVLMEIPLKRIGCGRDDPGES